MLDALLLNGGPGTPPETRREKHHVFSNVLSYMGVWVSLALVISVCMFVIINVANIGIDVISPKFLFTDPTGTFIDGETGGILTPMIGTVLLTVMGTGLCLPFALSTAIYLRYYAKENWYHRVITMAIDILSSIPTVVIGIAGLTIFTMPMLSFLSVSVIASDGSSMAYGKSFLISAVAMAVMIMPFVTKSIDEALKTVPEDMINASLALGVTKWHTVLKIALRVARPGIITGTILGSGRIIGDTAIVWMLLGGTMEMTGAQPWYEPQNWISTLRNTGSTLTTYIYYSSPAGEGDRYDVAFGASLVLLVVIVVLNALTAFVGSGGKGQTQK